MLENQNNNFNFPIYYPPGCYKKFENGKFENGTGCCILPISHQRIQTGWYRTAGKKEKEKQEEEEEDGEDGEKEEEKEEKEEEETNGTTTWYCPQSNVASA